MARKDTKAFYASKLWERTRQAYAQSVDGLCERCLERGIYTPGKITHHKIRLTGENVSNPDISLSFGNLELLCLDCHNKEHFKAKQSRYYFDDLGNMHTIGD